VLLLVVLSLLVLFMLIGTAFLMSSNQYKTSATASSRLNRVGNFPTELLDRALMQVLCDTGNPNSVIRTHSLLRDFYGTEGFEALVYSPLNNDLDASFATPVQQVTRYATEPTGPYDVSSGTPPRVKASDPTRRQLIDIYVRELAYKADDPQTPAPLDESTGAYALSAPDARHILKLERSVLGLPEMYNMPLTKGYFNGCVLTITSGPAAGQSTRIVDYQYVGDMNLTVTGAPNPAPALTQPFPPKLQTRLFRLRVMAFPNAAGSPLLTCRELPATDGRHIDVSDSRYSTRGIEIADLAGATFIVNGRPFSGTGVGFNQLAKTGEPRLNAHEGILLGTSPSPPMPPVPGSPIGDVLYPQIALTPNAAFFFNADPAFPTNAAQDSWGARYFDPVAGTYLPLNPTDPSVVATTPINLRPVRWKYQTFSGPGDADESYDAPDSQNMALALQTVTPRARGRVVHGRPDAPVSYEIDSNQIIDNQGNYTNTGNFLRLDLEDLPWPSYHRPDLENYWFHKLVNYAMAVDSASADDAVRAVLAPYGADGIRDNRPADPHEPDSVSLEVRDQIVALKRKISLRPLPEDHPNFDGSNPASRPPALADSSQLMRGGNIAIPFWEAVGPWDVDNDNDGVGDSVWVDLGDPVQQAEDGTLYKPLYAFLIVDLDSRLNVNAHGLVDHLRSPQLDSMIDLVTGNGPGNLAHDLTLGRATSNVLPAGSGYGPAEISLRPLFSPNLPGNANLTLRGRIGNPAFDDYARILAGRPAVADQPSVWGRHGSVNVRGNPAIDWTDNTLATREAIKVRPGIPFDVTNAATQVNSLDRLTAFKFFGYPLWLSNYYGTIKTPSSFSQAPDLLGRYATGLDYAGQPVSEPYGDSLYTVFSGDPDLSLLYDTPYELDLSESRRRDTPDPLVVSAIAATKTAALNDDAPFATAELEHILRAHDADSGILPDRLWSVVDAFDPLKLRANQPALVNTAALSTFGSAGGDELLAAAQQLAEVNRRLVTTDSYDVPAPTNNFLKRLIYGADGQPGQAGIDDDGDNGPDDPGELGWQNSDDWYAVMYRGLTGYFNAAGAPTPPAGIRLEPQNPTIVDLLRYRLQYERWKKNPASVIYSDAELTQVVQQLFAPEILSGNKIDVNRPLGDGRDNGDGIDNDGDGLIDENSEDGIPGHDTDGVDNDGNGIADEPREVGDPYLNGIVDDPIEAGEPFLDTNSNGKWDLGELWIDSDNDRVYDAPLDRVWNGLTAEPITFDYTQGHGEPLHREVLQDLGIDPDDATIIKPTIRNLNSQGRQLLARQLYCLMMLLVDENYLEMPDMPSLLGNNLNLELQTLRLSIDNGNPPFSVTDPDKFQMRRKLTAQRIAQWAINCVDMRDADSIMTAFEYDEYPWDGWGTVDANDYIVPLDGDVSTDENLGSVIDWENLNPNDSNAASVPPYRLRKPLKQITAPPVVVNRTRGVVWGAERPELLITETLAFHDRRCTDEGENGSVELFDPNAPPEQRDYDLDQRLKPRGSLFVELYNPWSADGNRPAEFYGRVPASVVPDQGVMLNRLSDTADFVSGRYSPVWRMTVLRDPLNGRMPVFRDPATKRLQSGVVVMRDNPSTPEIEGYGNPDPNDLESVSADFLTIDPDGYGLNMDEAAERFVYFTTGRNYLTGAGSDPNRADDENQMHSANRPGEWDFSGATPNPLMNQLLVRVPPLPQPRVESIGTENFVVSKAKRYFIARKERIDSATPNDDDITVAPILPGRYAVVGSSGLQLVGLDATTARADVITERFVMPLSRSASLPQDENLFGTLPGMRRIELWPDQNGRPTVNQVLVAENGGPEFIRINNNTVVNATDPNLNGNPTDTPAGNMLIEPAIAIPVEDLSVSEPVDGAMRLTDVGSKDFYVGYPTATYRRLYALNQVQTAAGPVPMPELSLRLTDEGEMEYWDPFIGDPAPKFYDRPLDTEFETIRNGTTQNYRSIHLQRLANPTLPWNPLPFDSAGNPNSLHRPWLPVNPYRTIDSQSTDMTAFNGATTAERTELPTLTTVQGQDLTTDDLQANILAPITAEQFASAPDHEIWAMLLLMKLKNINCDNSPEELRQHATMPNGLDDIENSLQQLEAIEPNSRSLLTQRLDEQPSATQLKYPNGLVQGWHWHMYRRVLPDDTIAPSESQGQFRQWLHLKSLERGFHASNYFKYPKPGAFYSANTATLEGWAPDLTVAPRTLWKQERPNARLFLQNLPTEPIVDASDLKTVTSRRVLSNYTIPGLTDEELNRSIPDSEITRNQLVWNSLKAHLTSEEPVFDYVMEQTLGFINESFAPDLERADGDIATAVMANAVTTPKLGAPEVARKSDRRTAEPLTFGTVEPEKEIWNSQRQSKILQGSNPPTNQASLLQAVVLNGSLPALEASLVQEFYERRRSLTQSTFPWLTWNDRPFTSSDELLLVPASSNSMMLREYSVPSTFTPDPTVKVAAPSTPEDSVAKLQRSQRAPFGHLLNLFNSSNELAQVVTNPLLPTGASNFQRILDFVEVPSKYVGTDTLLSPEVFNDNPLVTSPPANPGEDITSIDDPRILLQPPFNKVSRQRDPGRVNLNTVTGRRRVESGGFVRHWSEVYDGLMHRYGDSNLMDPTVVAPNPPTALQLGHFGPAWRDVALSRRGYAEYFADPTETDPVEKIDVNKVEPETYAFGLNPNFPSIFSNPFRSADAGDLVPLANLMRSGVEATLQRGHHWQRADDNTLITNPFATVTGKYQRIGWGQAGVDDDGNGIVDDIREAGWGIIDTASPFDGDTLRIVNSTRALEGSGIPLFSEQVPEPAIDGERNPGMMYQPMTRLGNLVTTRSNVYAVWVTVGYFEVERAPDWDDTAVRQRFGATTSNTDPRTIRGRALYDRVYPDGYTLGEELGTDTGDTNRQRAFYIIDRTEPVGFKPGEDLNVENMIRVRRRIE